MRIAIWAIVLILLVLNTALLIVNLAAGAFLWALVNLVGVAAGFYSIWVLTGNLTNS